METTYYLQLSIAATIPKIIWYILLYAVNYSEEGKSIMLMWIDLCGIITIAVHFQILIYHLSTLLVVCSQLFMINSMFDVRCSYRVTFIFKLIDSHFNHVSYLHVFWIWISKYKYVMPYPKKTIEIIRIIHVIPISIKLTIFICQWPVELLISLVPNSKCRFVYNAANLCLLLLARHYSRMGWQDLHRPRFR